jgi:hypothetical protein
MRSAGLGKLELVLNSRHVHFAIGQQHHDGKPGLVAKGMEYSGQIFKLVYS